jgi:protease-4
MYDDRENQPPEEPTAGFPPPAEPRPPEPTAPGPQSTYRPAEQQTTEGRFQPPPLRWRAPQPSAKPPRPSSSAWSVVLVLFGLALFFFCFVGIGFFFLVSVIGGGEQTHSSGLDFSFGEKIGLVRIEGIIAPGADMEFWMESMRKLRDARSVRGVVVRINSPGGSVGASQELQSMLLSIRNDYGKPVYVSMGDVAASGGYYVAAGADEIYALKGSLTGSIGVILSKPELSKLTEKLGVDFETIQSGRFKGAGDSTRPLSDQEREMFDHLIKDTYGQFLDDIIAYREDRLIDAMTRLSPETWATYRFETEIGETPAEYLKALADGRAYTGQQAFDLGLVDELGTLDDTIQALADELHISGTPTIQEPLRQSTLRDLLGSKLGEFLPTAQAPLQYRMILP